LVELVSFKSSSTDVRLFKKIPHRDVPQPPRELTYSSPYPTPLPPTQVSEEKGLWVRPFRGYGREGLPSELVKHG